MKFKVNVESVIAKVANDAENFQGSQNIYKFENCIKYLQSVKGNDEFSKDPQHIRTMLRKYIKKTFLYKEINEKLAIKFFEFYGTCYKINDFSLRSFTQSHDKETLKIYQELLDKVKVFDK